MAKLNMLGLLIRKRAIRLGMSLRQIAEEKQLSPLNMSRWGVVGRRKPSPLILNTLRQHFPEELGRFCDDELLQPSEEEAQRGTLQHLLDPEIPQKKRHCAATGAGGEGDTRKLICTTLGALVSALLPLAEQVISDEYTAEERRDLRESIDSGFGIFNLSNALHTAADTLDTLCGEDVRNNRRNAHV